MRGFFGQPAPDLPPAKKGGAMDGMVAGLLKSFGVDPTEVVRTIEGIGEQLRQHNERMAALESGLNDLKLIFNRVTELQTEVLTIREILRLTSPDAALYLHNRDIAVAEAAGVLQEPEPPPPSNGAFRTYTSLEEARREALGEDYEPMKSHG